MAQSCYSAWHKKPCNCFVVEAASVLHPGLTALCEVHYEPHCYLAVDLLPCLMRASAALSLLHTWQPRSQTPGWRKPCCVH